MMNESEIYDELAHEAHCLIAELVSQALTKINNQKEDQENEEVQKENRSTFQWPSIAEFTSEKLGLEKITEYIEKVTVFVFD